MKTNGFAKIWIAVAVIAFLLESLLGRMLQPSLINNGGVPWRLMPEGSGWGVLAVGALVGGFAFAYIFLQGYQGGGWREGLRFGFWVTLLASVPENLGYAVMLPVGRRIPLEFIAADCVTFVVCGIAAATLARGSARARAAAA
ncbi:MAG TPA: hypothetical protein VMV31_04165 [Terriglobales bacterium]|nr:hypothetical protein [Terriglobales bacterium]